MLDVFPTVAKQCHARLPDKPLDGIDIWPLLSGESRDIPREPLLYFENVNLECSRWKNWKLHVSRSNTVKWSPAPARGVQQFMLPRPELYDLSRDADESYDVAQQHPGLVRDMVARMEAAMKTFPPEIQKAWADTKARKADLTQTGNVTREERRRD